MPWFIYILECGDGSLYTGITNDLEGRFIKHIEGKASKYTRSRGVVELLYKERATSKSKALRREYAIKQLERSEKLKLISKSSK